LIGNVLLITEILRRVHSREKHVREQQIALNELIARKQSGEDLLQGEINVLEGDISNQREMQRLDLQDLAARKEMVEASRQLMRDNSPNALMARESGNELEARWKQGLHIENLHVQPGFGDYSGVRQPGCCSRTQRVDEDMLAKNGYVIPLVALSSSERLEAVNLLTDTFLNSVADDSRREAILSGRTTAGRCRARRWPNTRTFLARSRTRTRVSPAWYSINVGALSTAHVEAIGAEQTELQPV